MSISSSVYINKKIICIFLFFCIQLCEYAFPVLLAKEDDSIILQPQLADSKKEQQHNVLFRSTCQYKKLKTDKAENNNSLWSNAFNFQKM